MAGEETDIGGIVGHLRLDASDWDRILDAAEARAAHLDGADPKVTVKVDDVEAAGQLTLFETAVEKLDGADPTVEVDVDTGDGITKLAAVDEAVKKVDRDAKKAAGSGGGPGLLLTAIVAIGPALVPLAAGVAAFGVGAAAAAGVGVLAFLQLKDEWKAGTLQSTALGKQIVALDGNFDKLKKTAADGVAPGFTKGLQDINALMPDVNRDVSMLSTQVGQVAGNTGAALVALFHDLNPLLTDLGDGLVDGSAKLEHWAQSSDGVQRFVAYAQNELPKVEHFLGEAATAASHFAVAFAPLGGGTLSLLTLTLHLLNAIPIGTLTAAAPAITGVVVAVKALNAINSSKLPVTLGFGPMAVGAGIAGIAVGLLSSVLGRQQQQQMRTTEEINNYTQALDASNGTVDDSIRKIAADNLQKAGAFDAAKKLGIGLSDLTDAALNQSDAQALVNKLWADYNVVAQTAGEAGKPTVDQARDQYIAIKQVEEALTGQNSELDKAKDKQADHAAAMAKSRDSTYELTAADRDLIAETMSETSQLGFLNDALDKLSGRAIDAKEQELQFKDAMAGVTDQVKTNGTSLDQNTAKGRSNTEWILDRIKQANSHAEAVGKETGSVEKATAALASDEAQLRKSAIAAGLNKAQVDALIKTYAATPSEVRTAMKAETDAALKKIKDLQNKLDDLHDKRIIIDVAETIRTVGAPGAGGGGKLAQHARGTLAASAGPALVGEDGPEIVELHGGERIRDAGTTRRIRSGHDGASAGGNAPLIGVQNVYPSEGMDESALAAKSARYTARLVA